MDAFFARYFPHDDDAVEGYHHAIRRRLGNAGRLLDLGCGDNRDLARYRSPGLQVWGVDFQAHPHLAEPEWFRLLSADGRVPFAAASFDGIASRWVLEHVARPRQFLAEVERLLRPGGWFIALTVDARHYVSWLSRLADLLPRSAKQRLARRLYGRPLHDTFPTVYRLNTPSLVRRQAERAGLQLAELTRFANADYFSFSPLLRRGAVLTDWLLERVGTGLGRLYMVATLHKPARTDRSLARRFSDPAGIRDLCLRRRFAHFRQQKRYFHERYAGAAALQHCGFAADRGHLFRVGPKAKQVVAGMQNELNSLACGTRETQASETLCVHFMLHGRPRCSSHSSNVRGQSSLSSRLSERSASTLPSV